MTQKHNAIEIVHFTLQQVSNTPDSADGWDIGNGLSISITCSIGRHAVATYLTLGNLFDRATLVRLTVLQNIDAAKAFLCAKVFTDNGHQIVEAFLLLQVLHLLCKLVKIE